MFVDEIRIYARAGHGGKGCVAFRREKYRPKGGPDGGNGGAGGSVILQADHDLNNLIAQYYEPRLIAKDGQAGLGKGMDGHSRKDLVVKVPCGTLVWRLPVVRRPALRQRADLKPPERGTPNSMAKGELVADLTEHGQQFVLCKGGRGGLGNRNFATAARQTPRFAQPGEAGEEGDFLLELRIMAEVGLVGYPNAGKSTLLKAISHARPKIAPYPFTTLHPQIGIVEYKDFHRLTVCDVPGLVEGAHRNVGLGHAFLRHIQRCKILVLLLDMAGTDGRLPWDDYRQLLQELKLYDPALVEKSRLVVANKMDEPVAEENLKQFKRRLRGTSVLPMAAAFDQGIEKFREAIRDAVEETSTG
jgi:GTP-binding protein